MVLRAICSISRFHGALYFPCDADISADSLTIKLYTRNFIEIPAFIYYKRTWQEITADIYRFRSSHTSFSHSLQSFWKRQSLAFWDSQWRYYFSVPLLTKEKTRLNLLRQRLLVPHNLVYTHRQSWQNLEFAVILRFGIPLAYRLQIVIFRMKKMTQPTIFSLPFAFGNFYRAEFNF
jgi:hypothetical protein